MARPKKEEHYYYLDVSRSDKRWDIYLNGTGRNLHHLPRAPDQGHPPPYYFVWDDGRVLPGLGVGYITQGQGEFETEHGERQILHAGTMFLIFPGIWHRYRPRKGVGWSYHWFHCDGGYVKHLIDNSLISAQRPILQIGLNSQVLRSFLTLQDRVASAPSGLQQLAAGNIFEILGSALAAPPAAGGDEELRTILLAAKSTLEERLCGNVDLQRLAESFGFSYNYFRRVFREHFGISPYQYYLGLRLDRAKDLLRNTEMTVNEIALSLQFDSANYFARIFQKKHRISPTQWRSSGAHPATTATALHRRR